VEVVINEKMAASKSFCQLLVIVFFRSMLKLEFIATKMLPIMPQIAPTMIDPGSTSTVGGVIF